MSSQSVPAQSQEPPAQQGSATVVGSAEDTEYAFDNSFTPALVGLLQNNPNLSIDEILANISSGSIGGGTNGNDVDSANNVLHHPTIVQYGQTAQNSSECRDTKKLGVLIANQNYVNISPLNTPIAESNTLAGELSSRGYDANVHQDKSSGDMSSLYNSVVSAAGEGDDIVAYFAGHGAPEGLCGINDGTPADMFSNAQVASVVSTATGKGAHIRFIMDSCHSGNAAQAVREERINELAQSADSLGDVFRVASMEAIAGAKEILKSHCHSREVALNQLANAIQDHQTNNQPPSGAPAAQVTAYNNILTGLQNSVTKTTQEFDATADLMWAGMVAMLQVIAAAVSTAENAVAAPPATISDYRTLGAQLHSLDTISNACAAPMEQEMAENS